MHFVGGKPANKNANLFVINKKYSDACKDADHEHVS